jgi:hypothetical protein
MKEHDVAIDACDVDSIPDYADVMRKVGRAMTASSKSSRARASMKRGDTYNISSDNYPQCIRPDTAASQFPQSRGLIQRR